MNKSQSDDPDIRGLDPSIFLFSKCEFAPVQRESESCEFLLRESAVLCEAVAFDEDVLSRMKQAALWIPFGERPLKREPYREH